MKKQYKTPRVRVLIPQDPKEFCQAYGPAISNQDFNDGEGEVLGNTDYGWYDDEE